MGQKGEQESFRSNWMEKVQPFLSISRATENASVDPAPFLKRFRQRQEEVNK